MRSKRKQQLYKLSVQKVDDAACELLFEIDHQGFYVGSVGSRKHTNWLKRQLKIALERMIAKVRSEEDKDV